MISVRHSLATLVLAACFIPGPASAQGAKRMEDPPARTEPAAKVRPARVSAADGPININKAAVGELMTLSGVGRKVAERIVAYREANGPFKAPDDIKKVEGIGPGLWEKNRARIVVK